MSVSRIIFTRPLQPTSKYDHNNQAKVVAFVAPIMAFRLSLFVKTKDIGQQQHFVLCIKHTLLSLFDFL